MRVSHPFLALTAVLATRAFAYAPSSPLFRRASTLPPALINAGQYRSHQQHASTFMPKMTATVTVPNEYENPVRKATRFEKFRQYFQIWMLRRPKNVISRLVLPFLSLAEGIVANEPRVLPKMRRTWGPNFCSSGQVVLGEFAEVEKALTSPQARTFRLGTSILDANHLPMGKGKGRNVFLLALSDEGAGGTGEHEAFRKAVTDYVVSDAALRRQKDPTARRLLERAAKDYEEMDHGEGGDFFEDSERGLNGFMVRYIHYLLFGIDPNDDAKMETLTELYYKSGGGVTVYWFRTFGSILRKLNVFGARKWPDLLDKAATIYEDSPALIDFKENNPEYKNMTKREIASACCPLLGIAALVGPQHLAFTSMGYRPLPAYEGHESLATINVTDTWDKINLRNEDEVERYLFECGRLWNPVSATHRIAQEEFTTKIGSREYTFPKGTIINIPIVFAMQDLGFWGPSTYEFDHNRKNLCPYSMIFHSVGDRSAGRICPGKDITMNMLTDLLQLCGEVHRRED